MKVSMKRSLGILLAFCMVLSLLALPGVTPVRAEGENASLISEPVYSHAMDELGDATYLPNGWSRSNQFVYGSSIQTSDGRTYYQMKRSNGEFTKQEGNALSWGVYTASAAYSAAVLKYDLMINNGDLTGWSVYLPTFEAAKSGNTIGLEVKAVTENEETIYQLYDSTTKLEGCVLTPGEWYTVELVYTGTAWSVYFTDEDGVTASPVENKELSSTLTYINMGISNTGGESFENASGATINGGHVAMNIDNLAVYDYVAGTSFVAAADSYEVKAGETVATGWTKTEGAYLPSVTYTSSNEKVAKVDENGVVTGISAGTATITATPAASSGMAAATTTVTVKDPNSIISEPVYANDMNESSSYIPTGWARGSYQYARASSNPTATFDGVSRTYYRMERSGKEGAQASRVHYENTTAYTASVLKYDIMLENEGLTGWTLYAPSFANAVGNRTISVNIQDTMKIGSESIENGKWYTVELVVSGTAWALYVEGVAAGSGTITATQSEALKYINMGIENAGGNSAVNDSGVTVYGVGVVMNIDNLAVYDYAAGTGFAAVTDSYELATGETVIPVWTKTPTDAYLPYVTYTSSDDTVATVDENGVVTGLKAGTVTITAEPSASSGLPKAQTKVTVTGSEETADYAIDGASMTLGDNLDMNFYIVSPADAGTGHYAKIVKTAADGTTATVTVPQAQWKYDENYQQYYVTFAGVAAKEMGDELTVTIYNSDDEAVSEVYTDSVKAYADRVMAGTTDEKLIAVCQDMLIYGAAAQNYWSYDTENLVSTGVPGTPTVTNTAEGAAEWTGSTLVLESSILMKVFFSGDAMTNATAYQITYTDHYGKEHVIDGTEFGQDEGDTDLYVPVTGLSVADINTVVQVNVFEDMTCVYSVSDSMASFVARSGLEKDIYKAIVQFGTSAYEYFHSES